MNEKRVRFLVKTHYPFPPSNPSGGSACVPYVIFDLRRDQWELLRGMNAKPLRVELTGRSRKSIYEATDRQRNLTTDVVTNGGSLNLERVC